MASNNNGTGRGLLALLLAGAGSALASYLYVTEVEPNNPEVMERTLVLPNLHPAFDGYRLVQLTDIHMGTGITGEQLLEVMQTINALNPDAVMLTGDYCTRQILPYRNDLIRALSALEAIDGVFAVPGNHDYWVDITAIRDIWQESGVVDLSNRHHTLMRDDARFHFAGVDSYTLHLADVEQVVANLPENGAAILLAHEPDYADISSQTGRFDLQLSGHSHGGQVNFPVIGAPLLPRYGRKYYSGLYRVGTMWQYTNRGIGTIKPRVRLNCRPEITHLRLRSAEVLR